MVTINKMRSLSSCGASLPELRTQQAPDSISKSGERMPAVQKTLDIPYFADMQLSPARYPTGKLPQSSRQGSLARLQLGAAFVMIVHADFFGCNR
jgi:hypothetical protein